MKRVLLSLIALLALGWVAAADPIGLTVGAKAAATDLLGTPGLSVKPSIDLAFGDLGVYAGAAWELYLVDFGLGYVEGYAEFDFSVAGLDVGLGAYNSYDFAGGLFGCGYATLAVGLPLGITPKVEVDVNYYPDFGVDLYGFLGWKAEAGPGTLGAEARVYAPAYPDFALDSLRFRLNYAIPFDAVTCKLELQPRLSLADYAFGLDANVYLSVDF